MNLILQGEEIFFETETWQLDEMLHGIFRWVCLHCQQKIIYGMTSGAQTDPVYKGRLSGSVNAWYDRESKTLKKGDVTTPIVLQ